MRNPEIAAILVSGHRGNNSLAGADEDASWRGSGPCAAVKGPPKTLVYGRASRKLAVGANT
jgi:hypothetical protein